jgi:hypothetical protein
LSAVASDNIVDRVEYLVKYLSYRVFGQAIYRHVILNIRGLRSFLDFIVGTRFIIGIG